MKYQKYQKISYFMIKRHGGFLKRITYLGTTLSNIFVRSFIWNKIVFKLITNVRLETCFHYAAI